MRNSQENNSQEIDLVYLGRKLNQLFQNIGLFFFRLLKFSIKNIVVILSLLIIGLVLGYVVDKYYRTTYKTEIFVIPNFNSIEYLYNEIENFKSNIPKNKEQENYLKNIVDIEIKPIVDVKSFIDNNQNREFLKVLSDNGEKFETILKDKDILKSNKVHYIIVTTKSKENTTKIVQYLFDNLNNSKYFLERQKSEVSNLQNSKIQLTKSIDQINNILDKLGNNGTETSTKDFNINTYDQLNNVIDLKKSYVDEISKIDVKLVEAQKIIYPINVSYDNMSSPKIYLKAAILLPLFLLGLYFMGYYLKSFYKKYDRISKEENAKKVK